MCCGKNKSMSHANETFFTAVGCMDGRVQDVIAAFGKKRFGVMYPDTITEAGLVGLTGKESVDGVLSDALKFKVVTVSLGKHHAKGVVVHGHQECAGNPVSDEQHLDDIRRSVVFMQQLIGDSTPVVGVFVKRSEHGWIVEEVPQTVAA